MPLLKNIICILTLVFFTGWLVNTLFINPKYTCPISGEREDMESCYLKQLSVATRENNLYQKVGFLRDLGASYAFYGDVEEGYHLLNVALSLCNENQSLPDISDTCSLVVVELKQIENAKYPHEEDRKKKQEAANSGAAASIRK